MGSQPAGEAAKNRTQSNISLFNGFNAEGVIGEDNLFASTFDPFAFRRNGGINGTGGEVTVALEDRATERRSDTGELSADSTQVFQEVFKASSGNIYFVPDVSEQRFEDAFERDFFYGSRVVGTNAQGDSFFSDKDYGKAIPQSDIDEIFSPGTTASNNLRRAVQLATAGFEQKTFGQQTTDFNEVVSRREEVAKVEARTSAVNEQERLRAAFGGGRVIPRREPAKLEGDERRAAIEKDEAKRKAFGGGLGSGVGASSSSGIASPASLSTSTLLGA